MSEFEYYEFQTAGRRLTPQKIKTLRQLSSRAKVNHFQASFIYNYGSFKGNPKEILASYFDAFMYLSNFRNKNLYFRLPKHLVDIQALKQYAYDYVVKIEEFTTPLGESVVVQLRFEQNEYFDWIDEDDYSAELSKLIAIRNELLQGDYRPVYLTLIANSCVDEDLAKDLHKFPVPPNLQNLSQGLEDLIAFLEIDPKLLKPWADKSSTVAPKKLNFQKLKKQELCTILDFILEKTPTALVEIDHLISSTADQN